MTETNVFKPRKPWLAMILSLLTPGLGQLYNGSWILAILLFATEIPFYFLTVNSMDSFTGLLSAFSIVAIFTLAVSAHAFWDAMRKKEYKLKAFNIWWVYLLIFFISGVVGTGLELKNAGNPYKQFKVPTGSMLQTLQIDDRFIAQSIAETGPPSRSEIVVFTIPGKDEYFVKRVIGLPGETIEIRNKTVLINGTAIDEPYVQFTAKESVPKRDNLAPLVLGSDQYFLMGDNRDESYDSRMFGPISEKGLTGVAEYIFLPGNKDSRNWISRFGERLR